MTRWLTQFGLIAGFLFGSLTANADPCPPGAPAPQDVYLYTGQNGGGVCNRLTKGPFATDGKPSAGDFGIPNDSLRSINVGSAVRLRVFADDVYRGSRTDLNYTGNVPVNMPAGFDRNVSSLRLQFSSRSATCDDLRAGEFALFSDPNNRGDCVVLEYFDDLDPNYRPQPRSYASARQLGIANDSVSSVNGGPQSSVASDSWCNGGPSTWSVRFYRDDQWLGPSNSLVSGFVAPSASFPLPDNWVSSASTFQLCNPS